MYELEAKLRVADRLTLRALLAAVGAAEAAVSPAVVQTDYVYAEHASVIVDAAEGSLVARVRLQGGHAAMTVKQRRQSELDRLEYETSVGDASAAGKMLELLGLHLQVVVKKTRQTIRVSSESRVLLDRVTDLGTFIEIEVLTSDGARAETQLDSLLSKFRHAPFAITQEHRGYDTLLLLAGHQAVPGDDGDEADPASP